MTWRKEFHCSLEPKGIWPAREGDPQKRQKAPIYSAGGCGGGAGGSGDLLQEVLKDGEGWANREEVGVDLYAFVPGGLPLHLCCFPQPLPREYIYFKPGKSQPLA